MHLVPLRKSGVTSVRLFELVAATIEARPPTPISAAVVSPAALFLAKVSTCCEKATLALL
jgi:hypothetical protein